MALVALVRNVKRALIGVASLAVVPLWLSDAYARTAARTWGENPGAAYDRLELAAELIELERQGEQLTVFAVSRPDEPFTHRFARDLRRGDRHDERRYSRIERVFGGRCDLEQSGISLAGLPVLLNLLDAGWRRGGP